MHIVPSLSPPSHEEPWSVRRETAGTASESKDWRRAAELWDRLSADFPGEGRCWLKAGEAYREDGQFERADQVLSTAINLFPGDRWIAHQHTMVARLRADWTEALRRAEQLRRAHPDLWQGWLEAAEALSRLGHSFDADDLRAEAAKGFPNEFWPSYWGAYAKARLANSANALRIWSDLLARFPNENAAKVAAKKAARAIGGDLQYARDTGINRPALPADMIAVAPVPPVSA